MKTLFFLNVYLLTILTVLISLLISGCEVRTRNEVGVKFKMNISSSQKEEVMFDKTRVNHDITNPSLIPDPDYERPNITGIEIKGDDNEVQFTVIVNKSLGDERFEWYFEGNDVEFVDNTTNPAIIELEKEFKGRVHVVVVNDHGESVHSIMVNSRKF